MRNEKVSQNNNKQQINKEKRLQSINEELLTAKASDTFSNCFETVDTAFAILCLVTNITSERDKP